MKNSHKWRKTQKKGNPGGIFLLSVLLPGKNHKLAIQLFSIFCEIERALCVRVRVPVRALSALWTPRARPLRTLSTRWTPRAHQERALKLLKKNHKL